MYKVVVVEDEEIARKGIIFTINWDALNCMIAGEAANGEEGAAVTDFVSILIQMQSVAGQLTA